jgi:hypothetical protein
MSKLKTKLANWFLGAAKKLDNNVVLNETILPPTENMILYDKYHIDRVHAQYMVSEFQSNLCEGFIEDRIPEILTRGLAEEIMKVHRDEIKKTPYGLNEGTIYELDVYMCKPQKKEASF